MDEIYKQISDMSRSIQDLEAKVVNHQFTPRPGTHECSFKKAWIETTNHAVKLNNPLNEILKFYFDVDEEKKIMLLKPEHDNLEGRQHLLFALIARLIQTQNQMMVFISEKNAQFKKENADHVEENAVLQKSLIEITRNFNKLLVYLSTIDPKEAK